MVYIMVVLKPVNRRGARARREAYATTGYSPFLAFTVGELQATVQRLLALGATLDGPIKYSTGGKARPTLLSSNSSVACHVRA